LSDAPEPSAAGLPPTPAAQPTGSAEKPPAADAPAPPPERATPRPEPTPTAAAAQPEGRPDTPRTVVSGRPDFAASLESFQGPLDLLLYLLKEDEVEITHIPIARILEQYLRYLDAADQWDLHLAGEFLVMATTLMEIKSRELLPAPETPEGEEIIEDPRSELVRQLLRYRQLKNQARALEERLEFWGRRRARGFYDDLPEPAPDEAPEPPPMPDLDLYELLTLFERLRQSVLAQVPKKVGYEGETLEEKVVRIEKILHERPFSRFTELIADQTSRADIALTFIALLELVRRRMIRLMQEGAYGNLDVKVMTPEEAEALAHQEASAADTVVDVALREKAEREAQLAAEAAALGISVEQLPWKKRRAALARPKFDGVVRPEDLEEIDAAESEISRRIDAILAAADTIVQRFEASRAVPGLPTDARPAEGPAPQASPEGAAPPPAVAGSGDEPPLTEADLAPKPEKGPDEKEEG
jgi:segregation and condensation protein A